MATAWPDLQAVIFDYGSTLVQFGKPQIAVCDQDLTNALEGIYGHADAERIRCVRERNRVGEFHHAAAVVGGLALFPGLVDPAAEVELLAGRFANHVGADGLFPY